MAGTRKFRQADGEEVEAEVIPFRSTGEHWNEYLLDDGTVFRIKLVVTEIARVKDVTTPRATRSTRRRIRRLPRSTRPRACDGPDEAEPGPDAE